MVLERKKNGDDVLRQKSLPVIKVDKDMKILIKNMEITMKKADGAGIAAPQVGVLKRIIVVRPASKTYVLINPEFKFKDKELFADVEGCLSVPGEKINVLRSKKVVVDFMGKDGYEYEMEASDLFARVIQHEVDHLDGKLIVDYKK